MHEEGASEMQCGFCGKLRFNANTKKGKNPLYITVDLLATLPSCIDEKQHCVRDRMSLICKPYCNITQFSACQDELLARPPLILMRHALKNKNVHAKTHY